MTRYAMSALLLTFTLAACSAPAPDEQTAATEQSQAAAAAAAQPATESESAAAPAPQGGCDDTQAQWIIGKTATPQDLEQARTDAKAKDLRSLKPSDAATMDFNPNRLNVDLDEKGVATAVRCG